MKNIYISVANRLLYCSLNLIKEIRIERVTHPSRNNWVDVSGVTERQRHEVSVQCSDSLEHQSDVTCRREAQEFWGGVICTWSAIDQRCMDLQRDK